MLPLEDVKSNVVASWLQLNLGHPLADRLDSITYPLKHIEIIVTETGGQVHLDELADPDDLVDCGPGGGGGRAPRAAGGTAVGIWRTQLQWKHAMFSKLFATATFELNDFKKLTDCKQSKVQAGAEESYCKKLQWAAAEAAGSGTEGTAELCKCPNDFTAAEQGYFKSKYCRRKKFWKCMERPISAGASSEVGIQRIYSVYYGGPGKKVSYPQSYGSS